MAGMVIRKVEAPPPSKCPIMAMIQVINATPVTLLPTFFIKALIIRSNMPTSDIMPKNKTEKINNEAVEWTPLTPAAIKPPISSTEKVPVTIRIKAVTVDTPIKALAGTVTLRYSKTMIIMIVANPNNANIISFMAASSS